MNNKIKLSGIFAEGYGIIPKKLMRMKIHNNIKLLLAYMLSYTGAGNECFPSYNTISNDLGWSKTTVSQNIKKCIELGFIVKSKMYKNPLNHANKYILTILNRVNGSTYSSTIDSTQMSTQDSTHKSTLHGTQDMYCINNTINNNTINNNTINNIYINILNYWNSKKICVHNENVFNKYFQKKHRDKIDLHTVEKTKKAIDAYSEILKSDKYYWTHKWSLWDFIQRGLHKFIPEMEPYKIYKKDNKSREKIKVINKYGDEEWIYKDELEEVK